VERKSREGGIYFNPFSGLISAKRAQNPIISVHKNTSCLVFFRKRDVFPVMNQLFERSADVDILSFCGFYSYTQRGIFLRRNAHNRHKYPYLDRKHKKTSNRRVQIKGVKVQYFPEKRATARRN